MCSYWCPLRTNFLFNVAIINKKMPDNNTNYLVSNWVIPSAMIFIKISSGRTIKSLANDTHYGCS